jgi:hypothetical protein
LLEYLEVLRAENEAYNRIFGQEVETPLKESGYWQTALTDPQAHAPAWHEYSLLEHIEQTVDAADQILFLSRTLGEETDVRLPMGLHDLHKVKDFIRFCRIGPSCPHYLQYFNHELGSAELAQRYGFNEETCFLIRWHGLAYSGIKAAKLIDKYGRDRSLLIKLLFVFTCDAYGKGRNAKQLEQIPKIISLIQETAGLAALPAWVTAICTSILEDQMAPPKV